MSEENMNTEKEVLPVLYILMRTDLDSMNPGKGMAQASHAANAFLKNWDEEADMIDNSSKYKSPYNDNTYGLVNEWRDQTTQGFGTVLVLDIPRGDLLPQIVDNARNGGLLAEVIHDPTYPLLDGSFVHSIPLDTCAYVFGDKNNDGFLNELLGGYKLHY